MMGWLRVLIGRVCGVISVFFCVWGHVWRDGYVSGIKDAAIAAKAVWRDVGPQGGACPKCLDLVSVINVDGELVCIKCGYGPTAHAR